MSIPQSNPFWNFEQVKYWVKLMGHDFFFVLVVFSSSTKQKGGSWLIHKRLKADSHINMCANVLFAQRTQFILSLLSAL